MNEVCPSCGRFVATLEDQTGWCHTCAGIPNSTGSKACMVCGEDRPLEAFRTHLRAVDGRRGTCKRCENRQAYLRRIAKEVAA